MDSYTTSQLASISGFSVDQLKEWDDARLLRPGRILRRRGKSGERRYTREQAVGLLALAQLRDGGVSGPKVRAAAGRLPATPSKVLYLVFDGRAMHPQANDAELAAMVNPSVAVRVVHVDSLLERL